MNKRARVIKRESAEERRAEWNNDFSAPGEAVTYELSPPCLDHEGQSVRYVWVSASTVTGEPETYAFPLTSPDTKYGPYSWIELPMSRKGVLCPDTIIREAGYTIVEDDDEWGNDVDADDSMLYVVRRMYDLCASTFGAQWHTSELGRLARSTFLIDDDS